MVAAVTGFPARSRRRPHGGPTPSRRSRRSSLTSRQPMASSTSRRLSSSIVWRISSRRRGSTGTATTGCLRRITSSGGPSRHSPLGTSVGGARPPPAGMGAAVTPGGCCDAHQKPRSHDTSRIAWAKLLARVGEEFPLECPACGGDIRLIAFRLLSECETIPGLGTLGNLRLLRTSCPRSTSTASEPCRGRGQTKAPRRPDAERLRADTRKTPLQRGTAGGQGKAWCAPGRQEHATHEPLVSRAMLAEVSLAGLSFFL